MGRRTPVGAGLLIVRLSDMKILLVKRSEEVTLPGVWAAPGGSVEEGEDIGDAAIREGEEELGGLPRDLRMEETPSVWEDIGFKFITFLATTGDHSWEPELNWENDDWKWVDPRRLPREIMPGTEKAVDDFLK